VFKKKNNQDLSSVCIVILSFFFVDAIIGQAGQKGWEGRNDKEGRNDEKGHNIKKIG
jgi:hypothetical protein